VSLDESTTCQKCGTETFLGAHFCIRCGSRLDAPAAPPEPLELSEIFQSEPPAASAKAESMHAALTRALEVAAPAVASVAPLTQAFQTPDVLAAPRQAATPEPNLEDIDRGFDFGEERTAISAGVLRVSPKLEVVPEPQAKKPQRTSDLSRDEVLRRVRTKQSLKRAGLSGLDLTEVDFTGIDLTRADLDGAKLDRAKLNGALLQNASLRNASLDGADLRAANLERADLSGANLANALLDGSNLRRANIEGGYLESASLREARMTSAELTGATLIRANLRRAELDDADLERADLSSADLSEADLENASLVLANLVGTNFSAATLIDCNLTRVNAVRADFAKASLVRAKFLAANLREASLTEADARQADLRGADLSGSLLDGMKLFQATFESIALSPGTRVSFIDMGEQPGTIRRLEGRDALGLLSGLISGSLAGVRYFGQGDLLRDARLDFGAGSRIHVDSRFENCVIFLGEGAELVIGEAGVLRNCQISGRGDITVHGCFFERESPGISGPRSLKVSAKGAVAAALEQQNEPTAFAFEAGCRLRVKITQTEDRVAAE